MDFCPRIKHQFTFYDVFLVSCSNNRMKWTRTFISVQSKSWKLMRFSPSTSIMMILLINGLLFPTEEIEMLTHLMHWLKPNFKEGSKFLVVMVNKIDLYKRIIYRLSITMARGRSKEWPSFWSRAENTDKPLLMRWGLFTFLQIGSLA